MVFGMGKSWSTNFTFIWKVWSIPKNLKPKPTDEISILAHPFIVAAGQLLPVASLCHQGELKQMIEGAEITYLHLWTQWWRQQWINSSENLKRH